MQLSRRSIAATTATTTTSSSSSGANSAAPGPGIPPIASPSHRASIPSVSLPAPPSPRRRSSATKAITGTATKSDSPGGRRSPAASAPGSNSRRRASARKGSGSGTTATRGSRWTQSPSESTLRQYDDTIVTMKKWLAAHKPELADSFDHVSELTLDAMLLYMDDAVDRGLSYNTVSRVNSALAAYFKFRLKRELPAWEEITDLNERHAKGNPCFSTRYRARYHSISRNGGDRRRRRDSEQDVKVKPILYPELAVVLNYLRDEAVDAHDTITNHKSSRELVLYLFMHAFLTMSYLLWTRLDELLFLKWENIAFSDHTGKFVSSEATDKLLKGTLGLSGGPGSAADPNHIPTPTAVITLPWRENNDRQPKTYCLQYQAEKPALDPAGSITRWAQYCVRLNGNQPLEPKFLVFPSFNKTNLYAPYSRMYGTKLLEQMKDIFRQAGLGPSGLSTSSSLSAAAAGVSAHAPLSRAPHPSSGLGDAPDPEGEYTQLSLRKGGLIDGLLQGSRYGLNLMAPHEALWWGGWVSEASMNSFLHNEGTVDDAADGSATGGTGHAAQMGSRRSIGRKSGPTVQPPAAIQQVRAGNNKVHASVLARGAPEPSLSPDEPQLSAQAPPAQAPPPPHSAANPTGASVLEPPMTAAGVHLGAGTTTTTTTTGFSPPGGNDTRFLPSYTMRQPEPTLGPNSLVGAAGPRLGPPAGLYGPSTAAGATGAAPESVPTHMFVDPNSPPPPAPAGPPPGQPGQAPTSTAADRRVSVDPMGGMSVLPAHAVDRRLSLGPTVPGVPPGPGPGPQGSSLPSPLGGRGGGPPRPRPGPYYYDPVLPRQSDGYMMYPPVTPSHLPPVGHVSHVPHVQSHMNHVPQHMAHVSDPSVSPHQGHHLSPSPYLGHSYHPSAHHPAPPTQTMPYSNFPPQPPAPQPGPGPGYHPAPEYRWYN